MDQRHKQQLAQRFGGRMLRQRLERQRLRHAEWFRKGRLRFGQRSLNWFCSLINIFCRMTGIYRLGYRQFHRLRLTEREVPLRRLPPGFDGFRILHLSDLHLDLDLSFTETLVKTLRDCRYDACVITGDFHNYTVGDHRPALEELRKVLEVLPPPVYGVLGNHDSIETVPLLEQLGLRMLLNEHVILRRGADEICLAGVDDPNIYQTDRLDRALRGVPPGMAVILLAHSPAIHRQAIKAGVDLLLAGHIHGGQICLPGGFMVFRNDPSPRQFWRGAWHAGETSGYTSRGTGACGVPLRYFCPPEAVVHVLRCKG